MVGLNTLKSVPHIRLKTKSYILRNAKIITCKMQLYEIVNIKLT